MFSYLIMLVQLESILLVSFTSPLVSVKLVDKNENVDKIVKILVCEKFNWFFKVGSQNLKTNKNSRKKRLAKSVYHIYICSKIIFQIYTKHL